MKKKFFIYAFLSSACLTNVMSMEADDISSPTSITHDQANHACGHPPIISNEQFWNGVKGLYEMANQNAKNFNEYDFWDGVMDVFSAMPESGIKKRTEQQNAWLDLIAEKFTPLAKSLIPNEEDKFFQPKKTLSKEFLLTVHAMEKKALREFWNAIQPFEKYLFEEGTVKDLIGLSKENYNSVAASSLGFKQQSYVNDILAEALFPENQATIDFYENSQFPLIVFNFSGANFEISLGEGNIVDACKHLKNILFIAPSLSREDEWKYENIGAYVDAILESVRNAPSSIKTIIEQGTMEELLLTKAYLSHVKPSEHDRIFWDFLKTAINNEQSSKLLAKKFSIFPDFIPSLLHRTSFIGKEETSRFISNMWSHCSDCFSSGPLLDTRRIIHKVFYSAIHSGLLGMHYSNQSHFSDFLSELEYYAASIQYNAVDESLKKIRNFRLGEKSDDFSLVMDNFLEHFQSRCDVDAAWLSNKALDIVDTKISEKFMECIKNKFKEIFDSNKHVFVFHKNTRTEKIWEILLDWASESLTQAQDLRSLSRSKLSKSDKEKALSQLNDCLQTYGYNELLNGLLPKGKRKEHTPLSKEKFTILLRCVIDDLLKQKSTLVAKEVKSLNFLTLIRSLEKIEIYLKAEQRHLSQKQTPLKEEPQKK